MTIIVFLIDTSASMLQKTYLGTTYLDYARLAVEQFLKLRQRDPASNGDRYMLLTFEEYPQNIKSGWKESQRIFNEQLKSLKAKGSLNFESSLESVIRLLTVSRMQSGSGAAIETYGFGRYPSYAEHVVIIPVVDGSSLPPVNPDARIPKPHLLTGTELSIDAFRWDQRMYPIVLRLPGQLQPALLQQQGLVPKEDDSIAQNFAQQMGGRSFSINLHRSLGPSIDQIIQRIQTNGVLVRFQKHGPDPTAPTENGDSIDDLSWRDCTILMKKIGPSHSCWQIPEAYWPDTVRSSLPQRTAHPVIAFKCENVEPLYNTELQLDKYELENSSSLAQYILSRKEPSLCWQVFVENSYKQPGLGFPFGYIKISTSSTVTLYIMPYNYPELLAVLQMAKEPKMTTSVPFQQKFDKYLGTVPAYYFSTLRKALSRIKVLPSALEEQHKKLYAYCNLGALQARIKNQGLQEFDAACSAVFKTLQDSLIPNASLVVKVSRSRAQLGKGPLTECAFRPAVAPYKANIPADAFKDASIFLQETPPQAVVPSLQFKNPFDISRQNLCSQLDKMRLNFDQQVQTNNLHVLEGGMPGQKIKLQHAEDLHNLPINKMGNYEEYMKSMNAIGLGPKRELEPQAARPHAFGNPFKLDKKNMSIVDEVGEVNASAGTNGAGNGGGGGQSADGNGGTSSERRERRRERATSEGGGTAGGILARPKRKQGPIDSNRLAIWKRRRRSSSICGFDDDTASSLDFSETQSEPAGLGDDMDEEEQEDEEQIVEDVDGQPANDGPPIAEDTSAEAQPDGMPRFPPPNLIEEMPSSAISFEEFRRGNEEKIWQNGPEFGSSFSPVGVVDEGVFVPCRPSTSEPTIATMSTATATRHPRKKRHAVPTISQEQFLQKQRQIRDLIRQIGLRNDQLQGRLMEIISERPLSRERRKQLLELGQREAKMFKRQKLVEQIGKELTRTATTNGGTKEDSTATDQSSTHFHQPSLKQNGFNNDGS